jgi:GMP synthase-like glutamine amidotransferase
MDGMRLHYLQHVPFETPGAITAWAAERGHAIAGTRLFADEALPAIADFDWLFIMGGPMNVYEDGAYPWLPAEKALIDEAVTSGKVVIGICLGAQLLADVLGGRVSRNDVAEIGWFPVTLTAPGWESPVFGRLPEEFIALHWHGDTFALPEGAVHIAESAACANQAFVWGDRAFGLQFHLECTAEELADLVRECGDELTDGPWIHSADQILGRTRDLERGQELLRALLDGIAEATAG